MAKKKVPQEICILCGEKPCVCHAGPPPLPSSPPEDESPAAEAVSDDE